MSGSRPLFRFVPAAVWMLAIFALSSRSTVPQAPSLPGELTAIAGHLIAYALLAILCVWGLWSEFARHSIQFARAFVGTVAYGVSDEFHQSFVPGRHAGPSDVLVDAVGAAIGLALLYAILRARGQRRATA